MLSFNSWSNNSALNRLNQQYFCARTYQTDQPYRQYIRTYILFILWYVVALFMNDISLAVCRRQNRFERCVMECSRNDLLFSLLMVLLKRGWCLKDLWKIVHNSFSTVDILKGHFDCVLLIQYHVVIKWIGTY